MSRRRNTRQYVFGLLTAAALAACQAGVRPDQTSSAPPVQAAPATFVNKVWRVASSPTIEPGMLYVFLSDGTLVISSPHGTPALGTWKPAEPGLTMVEEGISYRVDIVALSAREFRIKINNPGEAVEITFVPAEDSAPPAAAR